MLNDLKDLNSILSMPPLEWAIETLLPRAGISILAGSPKAGKSVIVLDNLLRGLQGRTAFGRFPQLYKRVLVVNIEGRHRGIKMREPMYANAPDEIRRNIFVSGENIKITHPNGQVSHYAIQEMGKRIKEEGFDLVVLDPMVSTHTADENDSQEMVAVLDALRDVGETTKAAFIIIHHARKMGSMQTLEEAIEQGGAMMRGASGIFGAVDSAILVWRKAARRLLVFAARYVLPGANVDPVEMQMDLRTMRMYPVIGKDKDAFPDPAEWVRDNPEAGWEHYGKSFMMGPEAVTKARSWLEL